MDLRRAPGITGLPARRLTEFLARNHSETLYLVGDIFDGRKLRKKFFWTPDHTRVIKAILARARHGTRVYYLTGNHDEFMRQFVHKQLRLGKVRVANEVVHTAVDGRRLLVTQGDRFDVVMTQMPWLARVGDIGYESLLWGTHKLNRMRRELGLTDSQLSARIKTGVKSAVQYLSGFDEQVMARCRRDGLKGVVCGHTHHAETRLIRLGIVSYNCGDWVESCTALSEDFSGVMSILYAPPAARPIGRSRSHPAPLRSSKAARALRRLGRSLPRAIAPTPARPPARLGAP